MPDKEYQYIEKLDDVVMTKRNDLMTLCEVKPVTGKQYKPFNLERALAGDKLARKHDLLTPVEWHFFSLTKMIVCCWPDCDPSLHLKDGMVTYKSKDHDLVMLPKTKKLWIAINSKPFPEHPTHNTTCAFPERGLLEISITLYENPLDWKIIEIEVEE